jgi:mono/diheme cytochrome c family protein
MKMMVSIKRIVLFLLGFTILSGSYLWANGDKHQEEKKKQMQGHHWAAPPEERNRSNPIPLSEDSVLFGQNLYLQNCTDCHGSKADGLGPDAENMEPKPSNLAAMAGHHSDGDMAWKIKKGKGPMPAWENIVSEEQIWNLVNFIQNLKENH